MQVAIICMKKVGKPASIVLFFIAQMGKTIDSFLATRILITSIHKNL